MQEEIQKQEDPPRGAQNQKPKPSGKFGKINAAFFEQSSNTNLVYEGSFRNPNALNQE